MISLPVPLSPRIRTGTAAATSFSSFLLSAAMADPKPKTTSSGGRMPTECAHTAGEALVVAIICLFSGYSQRGEAGYLLRKLLHFGHQIGRYNRRPIGPISVLNKCQ